MSTDSVRSAAGREDDGFWPVTRCPSTTCGAQGGPASKSGSVCHSRPPMLPCHPSTVFDLRARSLLVALGPAGAAPHAPPAGTGGPGPVGMPEQV